MKNKIGVNQKFLDFPVDRIDANVYVADVNNKHMERTMILTDATAIAILNNDIDIYDVISGQTADIPDSDYEYLVREFERTSEWRNMHPDDQCQEIIEAIFMDIVTEYSDLVDEAQQAA